MRILLTKAPLSILMICYFFFFAFLPYYYSPDSSSFSAFSSYYSIYFFTKYNYEYVNQPNIDYVCNQYWSSFILFFFIYLIFYPSIFSLQAYHLCIFRLMLWLDVRNNIKVDFLLILIISSFVFIIIRWEHSLLFWQITHF